MSQEVERKHIIVGLDVWETLTDLKRGNMTYNDVIVMLLEKAGIEIIEVK
jgi:predicted CopG family antitoxin